MYADTNYYLTEYGGIIPAESVPKFLAMACERIDTATFNRIPAIGFDRLTPFQQEKIKLAACLQADFMYENGPEPIAAQSYSVLDISVTVGTANTEAARAGMASLVYECLKKTGLCCRLI